jgi:hypothetical protein
MLILDTEMEKKILFIHTYESDEILAKLGAKQKLSLRFTN